MQLNTNNVGNTTNNMNNTTNKDISASHNTSSFIKFNNGCIN